MIEFGKTNPSAKILENVYTFAFAKKIKINLEAKGLLLDEEAELQRQYEIFRRIRKM